MKRRNVAKSSSDDEDPGHFDSIPLTAAREMSSVDAVSSGMAGRNLTLSQQNKRLRRCFQLLLCISALMLIVIVTFVYVFVEEQAFTIEMQLRIEQLETQHAIMQLAMNTSADPCEDFYEYACGGWLSSTTLPESETRWSRSFDVVQQQNMDIVVGILESAWPVLGPFYTKCMDTEIMNARNNAPLASLKLGLLTASSLSSLLDQVSYFRTQHGVDLSFLAAVGVQVDDSNPNRYVVGLWQNGFALPARSYYETNFDLEQYSSWIKDLFELAGDPISDQEATGIVTLEAALASISMSPEQTRDPEAVVNIYSAAELDALLGSTLYRFVMRQMNQNNDTLMFNVAQPEYFSQLRVLLGNTSVGSVRRLAEYNLYMATFDYLSDAHRSLMSDFREMLYGSRLERPRNETCASLAISQFPLLVGRYYTQEAFDETSRALAGLLIEEIESSIAALITNSTWMDESTKSAALLKLNAIRNQVGHPDVWPTYDSYLTEHELVLTGNFFEDYFVIALMHDKVAFAQLSRAVDRNQWYESPSTVNAWYNPNFNQITFPAGILQYPFFSALNPTASNYGAMGVVMGHEITHGFDDQGRQFDASGYLRDWWSTASEQAFEVHATCIADQYSHYEVQPGVFINGQLTLGENIADLGGVHEAYAALKRWQLTEEGHNEERLTSEIYGMSSEEIFFVSFAQLWCEKSTPEYDRAMASQNPHSAAKFRVQGPLSNFAEFANTYECSRGSTYSPASQCSVW